MYIYWEAGAVQKCRLTRSFYFIAPPTEEPRYPRSPHQIPQRPILPITVYSLVALDLHTSHETSDAMAAVFCTDGIQRGNGFI